MKRTSIWVLMLVVLGVALVGCGPQEAETAAAQPSAAEATEAAEAEKPVAEEPAEDPLADAEYVIRVAINAPESMDTDVVQWEQEFALANIFEHIVEARAGGRVNVEVYANGQLGDHKAVCEMVQSGGLEAAVGTGTMGQFFAPFEILYIPYLFKSEELAWEVFDNSEFWVEFKEDFEEGTGMALLAMGQNGTRHFTHTKKQIQTPADLKGERIRVMTSPIFVEMMKAFGADAVPIAWNELYTSLQTGVVDGQENPISVISTQGLWEVQDYITLDGHLWSEDYFIMNADYLRSMPEDLQQIIQAAARQAEVTNRAVETIHSQSTGLANLAKVGMSIYTPSVAEKQQYADIAQPPVLEYLRDKVDARYIDGLLAAVADAEKKYGYR